MLNRKSAQLVKMKKRSTSPEAADLGAPPQQAFCPSSPHSENLSLSRAKPMLLLVCSYARFEGEYCCKLTARLKANLDLQVQRPL